MDIFQKKFSDTKKSKNLFQLIKFGIVGVSNTLVDFFVFSLLIYVFFVKPEISQGIAYTAGTINSFIFNRKWTFKSDQKENAKLQAVRFIIINVFSLILSSISISYLIEDLKLSKLLAKALVILLTQVINYLAYKLIVFKK